ncbi:MAG: hypothetical protein Q4G46_09150 [Propionibacteriaceae bacterium]|nr:hypothetical protein [Propionibacteriaceae bacterium]
MGESDGVRWWQGSSRPSISPRSGQRSVSSRRNSALSTPTIAGGFRDGSGRDKDLGSIRIAEATTNHSADPAG